VRRWRGALAHRRLGALVLALLFFVLMALVMGLLLALTPLLGTWGALGVVVAGLLLLTLLAGWASSRACAG
jgi:hypothetical protein